MRREPDLGDSPRSGFGNEDEEGAQAWYLRCHIDDFNRKALYIEVDTSLWAPLWCGCRNG